jgi:hypothetical protein
VRHNDSEQGQITSIVWPIVANSLHPAEDPPPASARAQHMRQLLLHRSCHIDEARTRLKMGLQRDHLWLVDWTADAATRPDHDHRRPGIWV